MLKTVIEFDTFICGRRSVGDLIPRRRLHSGARLLQAANQDRGTDAGEDGLAGPQDEGDVRGADPLQRQPGLLHTGGSGGRATPHWRVRHRAQGKVGRKLDS